MTDAGKSADDKNAKSMMLAMALALSEAVASP